jgi:cytochrome b involved in lipid metabolism
MAAASYTLEEVAAHNQVDDCWLIVTRNGKQKVYDTTKYLVSLNACIPINSLTSEAG